MFSVQRILVLAANPLDSSRLRLDEELREIEAVLSRAKQHLVRRSLYLLATEEYTPATFFAAAASERGPFGEHLRRHLFRLQGKADLTAGLLEILRSDRCADEQLVWRLEGAGLVRREEPRVVPRCELYAAYFQKHLG